MTRTGLTTRNWLATLALSALIWAAPGQAQSPSTTPQDRDDLARWQLAAFDQFLDNHPELSEQLRKHPSLVGDKQFVETHPALQQYLQQHPEVRTALDQNPGAVMHQERRYERTEDRDGAGITRGEVARMDQFLDRHPEISEQLQKDPKLIDDKKWVGSHPELQQFLIDHPEVRQQFDEHPNAFMRDEQQFDRRTDRPDITRGEVARMDQFLDRHPEISEQLQKDPKLIDDKKWVGSHPELQQFLIDHPEVRQQFDEHPNAFMRDEQQFDRRTDRPDITRGEVARMDQFLDRHPEISEQLQKDPKLIDDKKWVGSHPELQQFLIDHPEVRQQFDEHPNAFMRDEQQFDRRTDRPDITRGEVARMDQFLDRHPEISEQLQKDPKLIDDKKWVGSHPELQQFLSDHPEARRQFDEHPYAFMRDENRYERWGDRHDGVTDRDRGQLSSFHEFLEGHNNIAAAISKNPTLATNDEYLQNHTELQAYLQANPEVKQQLNQNPQSFIKSAQGAGTATPGTATKATTTPKMPGSDPNSK